MSKLHLKMTVNGKAVEALAEPRMLLIHFLREELDLTGPHIGCDTSHCGACTVDLNGKSVKACTLFVGQADGAEITTIEGLSATDGTRCIVLQESLPRASRAAMRLLHAGHDHPGPQAAAGETRRRPKRRSASACPVISAAAPDTRTSSRPSWPRRTVAGCRAKEAAE